MRLGLALLLATALLGACSDDDATIDAGLPDAATFDAPATNTCAALINLNTAGTTTGNETVYMGPLPAGAGTLEPSTTCTTDTDNEVGFAFTVAARSKVVLTTVDPAGIMPDLDTVLHVRSDCAVAASELGCNDDASADSRQSRVVLADVAAGTTLVVVVDSYHGATLPQNFKLTATTVPFVGAGAECDPTQEANVCTPPQVCSATTTPPTCAASAGGPSITTLGGWLLEGGDTGAFEIAVHDPDGDILTATGYLLDAGGPMDLNGDGVADEVDFGGGFDPALPGLIDTDQTLYFGGMSSIAADVVGFRLLLTDSAGNTATDDGDFVKPTYGGLGDACSSTLASTARCSGEMTCTADVCTAAAGAATLCTAADAATPVSAAGTTSVTIATTATDAMRGSCYYETGHAEAIVPIRFTGADHMRLVASTDLAANPENLDTYLYVRSACTDPTSELGCNDDVDPDNDDYRSEVVAPDLAPDTTYYLVVDGSSDDGLVCTGDIDVLVELTAIGDLGDTCNPLATPFCVTDAYCVDPAGGTAGTCNTETVQRAAVCAAAPALTPGTAVTGQLYVEQPSLFTGTCAYATQTYGVSFGERVYSLTLAARSLVNISTGSTATDFDTVVYVKSACDAATTNQLGCDDDIAISEPFNYRSNFDVTLDPGVYYIVVEMSTPSAADSNTYRPLGTYTLDVTATPL